MSILLFARRFLLAPIVLYCGSALSSTEMQWPAQPKLVELPTPYGTLAVGESEYVYESHLHLDGVKVEPHISGMLNISYAFSMPQAQAALVTISRGNEVCPVSYRWIVLQADGYRVSPEFGSCSEDIRVTANSKKLTLQTPSQKLPGALDVYEYDGKTVTHSTNHNAKNGKK